MVTAVSVICLVPAAFVLVLIVLPAFADGLPAFLVILPGILALSVAKVLSSYISGLGLPAPVATASVISLVINVAANLLLIPAWGIVGASAASLISYTVQAVILLGMAVRLTHRGPAAFLIPGREEVRRLRDGVTGLLGTVRRRNADAEGEDR